jgi:uncharacterized repeat protein (TIGR03943 family)
MGYVTAAATLGLVMGWRVVDGSAGNLVQGWYLPVLAATAVVLLVLALAGLDLGTRGRGAPLRRPSVAGTVAIGFIAGPIVLGAMFQPRPLASANLDLSAPATRQLDAPAAADDPSRRNVFQWAWEFETAQPAAIAGQPVDVIGFVFRRDGDPPDRFLVARFVVACCIADGQGFTLPVQWRDASTLVNDQWVRVTGRVGSGPDGAPIVRADNVELIEAPENPYIYP